MIECNLFIREERSEMNELFTTDLERIITEEIEVVLMELQEKKKKKKPHCEPRGKWHSKTGKFSSKSNAGSWSGSNPRGKTRCTHGRAKSKGGGERQITSLPCGRKDKKDSSSGKAKYRCYDGKEIEEQDEKAGCHDLPTLERMKCEKADDASRERSAEKRKKKKSYSANDEEMRKLSKGIVESEENFITKWKAFVKTLSKAERHKMSRLMKKPTIRQKLGFCSLVADASSGDFNDDELKRQEKEANLKLKKVRQRANS